MGVLSSPSPWQIHQTSAGCQGSFSGEEDQLQFCKSQEGTWPSLVDKLLGRAGLSATVTVPAPLDDQKAKSDGGNSTRYHPGHKLYWLQP